MLKKYAQEISEYLSSLMGRSIIITDTNGIIIGSPAKERLGDFHPPSVPCVKYKKMSVDDEQAAKKLGVWYPGSTVPLFYNGSVIGTAAIAGDPQIVMQFTMLVKNQIESMLREKIFSLSAGIPQRRINELVRDIASFNPADGPHRGLFAAAERLGVKLELPRSVIAIYFSNFCGLGLGLEKNPVKLMYEQSDDPISDELDYMFTHRRLIELIREAVPDPQSVIAGVAPDKLAILYSDARCAEENAAALTRELEERAREIYKKLKEDAAIETKIGLGYPAASFYDLPKSYANAWELVEIAEKTSLPPGVYAFDKLLFDETVLHMRPHYSQQFAERALRRIYADQTNDLAETFKVYCESFFCKQRAAEKMHLHRNTLAYRLKRIEELLDISTDDFKTVLAYYLTLCRMELRGEE